jgi:hypothetical protein
MAIQQLSVFLENSAGHASRLATVLEQAGVSIRGLSLADTGSFGIARVVVDNPQRARQALDDAGFVVNLNEMLCVELPDRPGELARILTMLAGAGVNIEYAYSLVSTYVAFKVADINVATAQLDKQPLRLVEQDEIATYGTIPAV